MNDSDWSKAITTTTNKPTLSNSSTGLQSQEKSVVDPLEYMQAARKGLGLLDRLKLDWRNSQAIAEQVEGIALALLRQQRESIEYQIMLDLDSEKKRRFMAYLAEVNVVEKQIFVATEESKKDLIKYMKRELVDMYKEKKTDIDDFQAMANRGEISQEDAELLTQTVTNWTSQNGENIQYKLTLLIKQYSETYQETLRLLKNRVA